MTLLELIDDFRARVDDTGGDAGTVPSGFAYYWEYADAGCLWKRLCFNNPLMWISTLKPPNFCKKFGGFKI